LHALQSQRSVFLKVNVDLGVVGQKTRQDFWQEICHGRGVGVYPEVAAQAAAVFV